MKKTKEEILRKIRIHIETTEECLENFNLSESQIEAHKQDVKLFKEIADWLEEYTSQQSTPALPPQQSGWISEYDIDFSGHVKARIRVSNEKIEVVGAMNGYGDGLSVDNIRIDKLPEPPTK